jgi:hypothetical protein
VILVYFDRLRCYAGELPLVLRNERPFCYALNPFTDAIRREPRIDWLGVRHEEGAA